MTASRAVRTGYHRVLLKLSGEAFASPEGSGISTEATALIGRQLAEVVDLGVQIAVVVGGGRPRGSNGAAPTTWGCSAP